MKTKTNTNASKTGVATPNSLEGSEVSEANDTIGGVPTQAKPHKRRMAREQASARTVERKADAGNAAPSPAPRATSKIASVIALLERTEGATLAEMVEATG